VRSSSSRPTTRNAAEIDSPSVRPAKVNTGMYSPTKGITHLARSALNLRAASRYPATSIHTCSASCGSSMAARRFHGSSMPSALHSSSTMAMAPGTAQLRRPTCHSQACTP
jgi:hypothetical protein